MKLSFAIIAINERLRKKGYLLGFTGIGIALLNGFLQIEVHLIPEKPSVWISALGIMMGISGFLLVGYAEFKKEKIGSLTINGSTILIVEKNKSEIRLDRNDFRLEIKNPGFTGMQSTYNILMVGSIVPDPGINVLRIYNQEEEYKFDILIENQQRLNLISELIKK